MFFLRMAVLNELVWRNVSTDSGCNFKVFGLMGLTLVFALANAPFMAKHMIEDDASKPERRPLMSSHILQKSRLVIRARMILGILPGASASFFACRAWQQKR